MEEKRTKRGVFGKKTAIFAGFWFQYNTLSISADSSDITANVVATGGKVEVRNHQKTQELPPA